MSGQQTGVQVFPFGAVLFLIFLTLKLTGYIAWSWWAVTAPLWGPLAVVIVTMAVIGLAGYAVSKGHR